MTLARDHYQPDTADTTDMRKNSLARLSMLYGTLLIGACNSPTGSDQAPAHTQATDVVVQKSKNDPSSALTAAGSNSSTQDTASLKTPAQSTAGPTIKGLALGQTREQVKSAIADLNMSDGNKLAAPLNIVQISGSQLNNATNGAIGCMTNLEDPPNGGFWIFANWETHFSGSTCRMQVHFDDSGLTDYIYIDSTLSNIIFDANAMSENEFDQALIDHYGIPTLDISSKSQTVNFGGEYSFTTITGTYESPDGWRIKVQNKTITWRKVTKQANRFN